MKGSVYSLPSPQQSQKSQQFPQHFNHSPGNHDTMGSVNRQPGPHPSSSPQNVGHSSPVSNIHDRDSNLHHNHDQHDHDHHDHDHHHRK